MDCDIWYDPGASTGINYSTHIQDYGWQSFVGGGAISGTTGQSKRLEAIQIVLVPKGGCAPGSTANCFVQR